MRFPISLADVFEARRRIAGHLARTPIRNYPTLDAAVGRDTEVWVKHENHHPTNAFKVRNALAAMTMLTPTERAAGVVAASRGNHGQALAWAGRILQIPVAVCVPIGNNADKNAAIRGFGGELVEAGKSYDETLEVASELARKRGMRVVHSSNDPYVMAGAATATLEMIEDVPGLDALVVPVGGGSIAAGAVLVARWLRPDLRVYAVQAKAASAVHDSFHAGRKLTRTAEPTFADGLATACPYENTFEVLCWGLEDFVAVTEPALRSAIALMFETTHNVAEGAGAAALAGLCASPIGDALAGKKVGIVLTGSNIESTKLREALGDGARHEPAKT